MTEEMTNQPPAGWYPNPQDSTQSRWWDGQAWTDHFNAAPTATALLSMPAPNTSESDAAPSRRDLREDQAVDPPVGGWAAGFETSTSATIGTATADRVTMNGPGYNPYNSARDLAARKNTPATNGFVFGIISILVNPFLLISIGAFIWSGVGLARAKKWQGEGYEPVGRRKAVWGIVLASVGTVISLVIMVSLMSAGGHNSAQVRFDKAGVEKMVADGVLKQAGAKVSVECPNSPSMTEGNKFQCVATADDGTTTFVTIRVQDPEGNITWELK